MIRDEHKSNCQCPKCASKHALAQLKMMPPNTSVAVAAYTILQAKRQGVVRRRRTSAVAAKPKATPRPMRYWHAHYPGDRLPSRTFGGIRVEAMTRSEAWGVIKRKHGTLFPRTKNLVMVETDKDGKPLKKDSKYAVPRV